MINVETKRPIITQAQWESDEYDNASGKKAERKTKRTTRTATKSAARSVKKAARKLKRSERLKRAQEIKNQVLQAWRNRFGTKATRKAKRNAKKLVPTGENTPNGEMLFQYEIPRLSTQPLKPIDTSVPQPTIVPGTMYKNTETGSVAVSPSTIQRVMDATGNAISIDKNDVGGKEVLMDENQPVVNYSESEVALAQTVTGTEEFVPKEDQETDGTEETGGWKALPKNKKIIIVVVGITALAFMGYAIYKSTKKAN